ncbi:MAG: DMT family transporter [Dongiaceae bacterium]
MTGIGHGTIHSSAEHRSGILLVAGGSIAWSSAGLLARLADTDVWTTSFWRAVFCALFLTAIILIFERRDLLRTIIGLGRPGIIVASLLSIDAILFIIALDHTSVANALFIMATTPFVAALLGRVVLKERVRPKTWVAIGGAFCGIALMVSSSLGSASLLGDGLAIVVTINFAIAMILMRRHRTINMRPAVWLSAIISILLTLPFASPLAVSTIDFSVLFAFGVFEMGLGLVLFTAGAQRIPPVEAAMIAILESILSPFWVWLFLDENPGSRTILGGIIVIAAVAAHTIGDLRPARAAKLAPAKTSGAAAPPADR